MRDSAWARCGDDSLPAQASQHHQHHTSHWHLTETESIYNVLCRDWGHVFTWHNVYIIQTRIFTPELSSLLEFTKAIRSQWDHFISSAQTPGADIMRTGEVAWQARQPSSFITGNSVMSVMHHRWGWCSRCIHLSPPICGPCAWSEEPHCVFPTICPHASFHSAPCQGGSLHQHCLTCLTPLSLVTVITVSSVLSSVLSLYTVCSLSMLPPLCPGHNWVLVPGWAAGQVGSISVSAHYISHRPRVPVSASLCLGPDTDMPRDPCFPPIQFVPRLSHLCSNQPAIVWNVSTRRNWDDARYL